MKGFTTVAVKTQSGDAFNVKASTDERSPYFLSGALLGEKIFKAVEDGEKVSVEGFGDFKVQKQNPTWIEKGKVTLILP